MVAISFFLINKFNRRLGRVHNVNVEMEKGKKVGSRRER